MNLQEVEFKAGLPATKVTATGRAVNEKHAMSSFMERIAETATLQIDRKAGSVLLQPRVITFQISAYLVGGSPTPLKNMKVTWDDSSQCMGK